MPSPSPPTEGKQSPNHMTHHAPSPPKESIDANGEIKRSSAADPEEVDSHQSAEADVEAETTAVQHQPVSSAIASNTKSIAPLLNAPPNGVFITATSQPAGVSEAALQLGIKAHQEQHGATIVPEQILAASALPEIPDEIMGVQVQTGDVDQVEVEASVGQGPFDHTAAAVDEYGAAGPNTMPSMLASTTIPLEEDASGDLSTSSNETLTLTSTVSRGNYHQCGSARRVKVYELKGETWHDRGTGYCAGVYDETVDEALLVARKEDKCQFLEGVDVQGHPEDGSGEEEALGPDGQPATKGRTCQFVVVVSENLENEDILLASKVVREEVYQRQQETLVVWTEPTGTDMALSFQEAEGCNEVWEFLTEVQKHFMGLAEEALSDSPPTTPNPQSPSGTLGMSASGFGMEGFDSGFQGLPDPELGNLENIELTLKETATRGPFMREKVAVWLLRDNYIKKLIPAFEDAEELEALPSLHLLCVIMQTILMLNDNVIFEYILQDDVFLGVVGMLEYDPEFPGLKASYREYLKEKARFKQVIEIGDPMIVAKIHQTYRLLYLKDVILARVLDDPTFSILNSFVFFHQSDIINYCCQNETFLTQLFAMLNDKAASDERKSEGVLFLQQLCQMGKQIQLPARLALYRTLTEAGLLNVVQKALDSLGQNVRNAAAEILMTIIEYDANSVRAHTVSQVFDHKVRPLISTLIGLLHTEQDLGLKAQMAETLRIIFDVGEGGPMAAQAQALAAQGLAGVKTKTDPDRFLTWIYDAEIGRLCSPLNQLPDVRVLSKGEKLPAQPRARSALYGHLCDLLCYMITHHSFRSQYFVLTSEISKKVGSLLHSREKHIRLSALRFFKHCLASNNQFTNRHFVKIELFSTILGLVEAEAERNNMICSACLDFFEHMRRENMKALINHCMEKHGARMRSLANTPHIGACFSALVLQWEKNTEPVPVVTEDAAAQQQALVEEKARQQRDQARRGANRTTMDSDEESYFDEEAPTPTSSGTSGSLVPYGDDEDEEDPPKLAEKRRRTEEEEEEDMVGRLAKRKSGSVKADQEEEGEFIKKTPPKRKAAGGGEKISLGLTTGAKKMAAQGNE